jgi:hypothetical protein
MSTDQKYPVLGKIASMLDNKEILETDISACIKRMKNEKLLQRFSLSIFDQYIGLVERMGPKLGCANWQNELVFSPQALQKACKEIEADLCVMLARRKHLVGQDEKTEYAKLAKGKIAGITTFRLSRAHIIHLSKTCLSCERPPCGSSITTFNSAFAIKCGLHFIDKPYNLIPEEIRMELLYTLTNRHTNQETLGIIFDTFKKLL